MRAIVLAPFDEASKRGLIPEGGVLNPSVMQCLLMIKDGSQQKPFVRVSMAYSCKRCQKAFEKTLAKVPSWCVVEINRGPDPTNRVVVGAT